MALRIVWAALLSLTLSTAAYAALGYNIAWELPGDGGFSAANLIIEPDSGQLRGIVACEGNTGVVCMDTTGQRLWEYPMEPPVTAAAAVADLDGDAADDVVAADGAGNLLALTAAGKLMWSARVPARVQADSCPAIADLDGDGKPEVLVGDISGVVSCFDNTGALLWQFQGDGTQMAATLIADIYDAPGLEIIVASHDHHVYALNAKGEWLWDLYFHNDLFQNTPPLLADVDGDNVPELYLGGGLHHFYRIDLRTHSVTFEENVYLHINAAIAAGDLDGDGKDEIVFGNKGGEVRCYAEGGFQWKRQLPRSSISATPLFLNLDDDPALEIILHSVRGDVQILDTDGAVLFSASPGFWSEVAPCCGDFDNDGMAELLVSQSGGTSGQGKLLCVELSVPYREELGNAMTFAGNRARTCRPPKPRAYPLLPTPKMTPASEVASAAFDGKRVLLSGPNTWRFDVDNPEEARQVLLADIAYPDGSVRHFARHVYGATARKAIDFNLQLPGEYEYTAKLVNADTLGARDCGREQPRFGGLESDKAYLHSEIFAGIEQTLAAWRSSNPRSAAHIHAKTAALKGMLTELSTGYSPDRVDSLAALRRAAERLRSMAVAGEALAHASSFFAWEFNPWAYFNTVDTLPAPENRTEQLSVSMCVGEYESLALNITNVCERGLDIRVLCDAFEGPAERPIAEHVELRRVLQTPSFRGNWVADALPRLDEAHIMSVAPLETQQLWITLNAKDLEPGEYLAKLRLKSIEPAPTEISMPIKITVHDLAMPRPRPLAFCMWAYDGGELGTDKPEILRELVDHGMTVFFGKSPSVQADEQGNLAGPLDFTAHDESVAWFSPHGTVLFIGPQHSVRGVEFLSDAWRKAFIAYLRAWVAHMKELGLDYDDWALYPYDEPSTPYAETTRNLVAVAKVIREADPQILIYTDPTSGTTMESVDMLKGLIDIWCPSTELLNRLGDELIPVAHETGKKVWMYDAIGRSKTLSCLAHYRWWFWFAWNRGFTGAGWWVWAHHGPDRWDGPNETGNYYPTAYDGPNGVVSSKRFEAAREGIEDYEYLYLLREAIADAKKRGVPETQLAGPRKLLELLPKETEATLRISDYRLPLTPDSVPLYNEITRRLEDVRAAIIEASLQLRPLKKTPLAVADSPE